LWHDEQSLTRPKASALWEARKFTGWKEGELWPSWQRAHVLWTWQDVQSGCPAAAAAA
jgi:hypothetical protein